MSKALEEQLNNPEAESLGFLERLGLLIDHEETSRADRRLTTRLRQAKLRMNASIEGNRSGFDGRFSFTRPALAVPGFDNTPSRILQGSYSPVLNASASG